MSGDSKVTTYCMLCVIYVLKTSFHKKIVQYVNNCNLNNFVYLTKLLKVRDTNQSQKT